MAPGQGSSLFAEMRLLVSQLAEALTEIMAVHAR